MMLLYSNLNNTVTLQNTVTLLLLKVYCPQAALNNMLRLEVTSINF